ncbi:pyridoxamine 5'-phosphate oxidase family protein [Algibacter sp.]|nr:pyridoxamine 5'-phosphate oxidase family protein [Algibacter sp.]MDA9069243.1 pyridoxamine 5'-phosphate oxidase family protein [Algibacter sp.]MDA9774868.1 pyridoxamine 5'-phosphate oxidase family protein [Algibacter sp.]MDC1379299.1 pyridoxamine 5'-phosphate oxidase family protein [Algibacter sp.]
MILKLGKSKCRTLLSNNYIGHLAYIYKNRPFVIPVTYYYDDSTNALFGYSGDGHKINALRINNAVSLEVADIESVNTWKSVSVQGGFYELEGSTAKINLHKFSEGVKDVVRIKEGRDLKYLSEFSSKIYKEGPPIVFKIDIEELTGRERK